MIQKTAFWYGLQSSTLFLYFFLIGGGYASDQPTLGWTCFGIFIMLHAFEMRTALTVGRERGLSDRRIVLKNLLFGFTWWVPLKQGILVK